MAESFNQEFCEFLEFHLCKTFKKAENKAIKSLWCDGIIYQYFDKNHINDKKQVITKAWIGKDGQEEYEMIINFGEQALKQLNEGIEIINCVPEFENIDWINLEIEKKKIVINLK